MTGAWGAPRGRTYQIKAVSGELFLHVGNVSNGDCRWGASLDGTVELPEWPSMTPFSRRTVHFAHRRVAIAQLRDHNARNVNVGDVAITSIVQASRESAATAASDEDLKRRVGLQVRRNVRRELRVRAVPVKGRARFGSVPCILRVRWPEVYVGEWFAAARAPTQYTGVPYAFIFAVYVERVQFSSVRE